MPNTLTLGPLRGYTLTITIARGTAPSDAPPAPDLLDQLLGQLRAPTSAGPGVPPHLVVRPEEQAIAGDPPPHPADVPPLAERLAHLPPEQQARIRAFLAGPVEELLRVADRALAAQADAPTAPAAKVRKYIGQ